MNHGFEPVFDSCSKVLILGSFPSVASRKVDFYYGNKQNRFWNMLQDVFNVPVPPLKEGKIEFLLKHKVALWDIVSCCNISGSADTAIMNESVNDLYLILNKADIRHIFCNGKKSYALTVSSYPMLQNLVTCLPSTSPANASYQVSVWKNAFKEVQP